MGPSSLDGCIQNPPTRNAITTQHKIFKISHIALRSSRGFFNGGLGVMLVLESLSDPLLSLLSQLYTEIFPLVHHLSILEDLRHHLPLATAQLLAVLAG